MSKPTTYPARLMRHKTLGTLEWEISIGDEKIFVPVFSVGLVTHYGPFEFEPDGDQTEQYEYLKLLQHKTEKA
jgi:hypothetical protein